MYISRKQAIASGLTRYRSETPCKKGHLADRYTTTSMCTECLKQYRRDVRQKMNNNYAAQARGFVPVTVHVRPMDRDLIQDFAHMVNEYDTDVIIQIGKYMCALKEAIRIDKL